MDLPIVTADFVADGDEEAAWQQLRRKLATQRFPRLYMRNAKGERIYAPIRISVGIDGILEPPHEPQYDKQQGADPFALPTDPIEHPDQANEPLGRIGSRSNPNLLSRARYTGQ